MEKNNLLVSIIVPVYNVEKYLAQCLDSLISQTYDNLEIICVNDGSPDKSGEILYRYAEIDTRVQVITQENQGLSGARNTGIQHATGEYVMFVDSDDWIEENTCELAVLAAQRTKADLVFWSYVREFQTSSRERLLPWNDGEVFDEKRVQKEIHRRQCGLLKTELCHPETLDSLVTAWGKMYSTKKLKLSGATFVDTREIGTEDALFNLYALGVFQKAVYLKKPLYHYRKTNYSSLTKCYKENLSSQWSHLFKLMRDYIEKNGLSSTYSQALDNRISMSIVGLGLNIMSAPVSEWRKICMLKEVMSGQEYRKAIKTLSLRYFPVYWKAFYLCAKWNIVVGIYVLLKVIKGIVQK